MTDQATSSALLKFAAPEAGTIRVYETATDREFRFRAIWFGHIGELRVSSSIHQPITRVYHTTIGSYKYLDTLPSAS